MKMSFTTLALSLWVQLPAWAEQVAVPAGTAPADGAAGAAGQPGMFASLFPMVAIFGIFYFLMIRPQQKRLLEEQNRKKDLLENLKHGDEVVMNSGLLGKVTGIADKVITLEVADDVKVKMLKNQVSQVIKQGQIKDLA